MFLPTRYEERALTASLVALLMLACSCSGRDDRAGKRFVSNGGARLEPSAPEPGAGGAGGQHEESGGTSGDSVAEPQAGNSSVEPQPEPAPEETPGVDEPSIDEPTTDEPTTDEPGVVVPPDDEVEPGRNAGLGLPCEVQALLVKRCQSCHSRQPVEGASISLVSYADLTASSKLDGTANVLTRCLKRMKDSLRPMPPTPANPVTVSELTPLQAWLDAGAPPGTCEDSSSSNPYDAPAACSSGNYWTAIDSGSPWMNPGKACIKCHRQYPSFAPQFSVAGTVFPTAHEPDTCFGVPLATGAQVVIIDANGQELAPIRVVSGGNFGAILPGLALPYRAKVVVGETERIMLTPQTSGDCNGCHTQSGAQGAQGRVIVP